MAGRQLEDLVTETPVHQREVTNGIDDGRDGVRRDVYQHALCPEIVVAEHRGMGFGHPSRSVPLLVRLLGASYLLLTNVQVLAVLCDDVGLVGEGDGKQHGRLQRDLSIKLPRFLRRHVELGGQFVEEVYPIPVPPVSLLFSEPDDYQVLLGGDVDVLAVLTAS